MVDVGGLIGARAVRAYGPEPVPVEMIWQIVDQARWTGSARNRQPWRFVAVLDAGTREDLSRLGAYAGHLAAAPAVLVVLSPAERLIDTEFDVGRIAQSITMVAASLGMGSCITSLYPDDHARRAAELVTADPGWTARHAIALGYPGPRPVTGRLAIPAGRLPAGDLLRIHP